MTTPIIRAENLVRRCGPVVAVDGPAGLKRGIGGDVLTTLDDVFIELTGRQP